MTFDQMRKAYLKSQLLEHEVHRDPISQFHQWFDEVKADDAPSWLELNAMTLSTAGADGKVASRIVLLKGVEEGQFCFFTNYESSKGIQIQQNPNVSLCILWPHWERQVRIRGTAQKTSREVSERYFQSRPRGSQLGAHVSEQSTVIEGREVLEKALERLESQYQDQPIPCPEHWGGYVVSPEEIEFWQGRDNRLHDRIVYRRQASGWSIQRIAP